MKKMVFITLPDARYGFGLAGVTQLVASLDSAGVLLKETISSWPGIGLVVLDERLIKSIGAETLEEIEKAWPGILLTLPAPDIPGVERVDYTAQMIRKVIGYHLRL